MFKELTKKQKKEGQQILIALGIYLVLVILEHTVNLPEVLSFLLFLIPYFIVGHHVLKKAILGIKHKQMFDESFLMTIATFGAFATGENAEAVAVMLFYQVGEWFQSYAVNKSRKSISELMDIAPEEAHVLREELETVFPDEVEIGEICVVKPGEKIPIDGIVIEGESMINTSALTGESVPRHVGVNDDVISGCINGERVLKIKTTKLYDDSTVAKILELVENAAEKKSKTESFITRFAKYYTPVVVVGALLLAFIPPIFVGNWLNWMYRACTFLVISCPCALVISVPLSFFGGIGSASKQGILVKGSNYLELMDQVDIIVSDKTGTLTKGNFKVTKIHGDKDILYYAACAESMSTHPIALSIKEAYGQDMNDTFDIENISGEGIKTIVNGQDVLVGNAKLMRHYNIDFETVTTSSTVVHVSVGNDYLGYILISDEVKPEAITTIQKLKNEGIKRFVMLTGDNDLVAKDVAQKLNIDEVYSELLPGDKVEKVEDILKSQEKVAFIGDGINDAPVLSRVDVGIAMGSLGSDAAIEAADIVIMDDNLLHLPVLKQIAHKTVMIAKENIVFALLVKIAILILGALGIANMWAAVFADVGVAFICILNAMRCLKLNKS